MAKRKAEIGLYKRPDDVYEKTKTVKGKRYNFYSKDPEEVWRQYYSFQDQQTKGPLFSVLGDEWYMQNLPNWRRGTVKAYNPALARAKDYFEGRRITEIEAPDVKNYLRWLKDKGFAEKTIKNHLTVVNGVFLHAIVCDGHWRKDNPAEYVSLPNDLPKKKRKPPTDEQIKRVRQGLKNEDGLLAAVFMYSGARLGEALALQGRHLGTRIIVEQEISFDGNQPVIEPYTKTEAGERDIGALDALIQLLPKNIKPDEFLFGGKAPWTYNVYRRKWTNWCRSVGLATQVTRLNYKKKKITEWVPNITPHQLRHEYASLCFEAGIDEKVAATMFGHADSTTMRQIYQSIRSRQIEAATIKMNELEKERSTE